jgi:cysteine synthase A
LTRQFENEANADIHSRTTAREIINDFKGEKLDYWVTGYGTGGTLKGVARMLAKEMPNTKIVLCEPDEAQLIASGIKQERNPDGSPSAAHPAFKPHPIQGWTPDFIPKLTADAVDMQVIERIVHISGPEGIKWSGELARKEGVFVGTSAGATFAGALVVAAEAPIGANILCMLPDTGERYLSTPLFANVPADMTEEELESGKRLITMFAFQKQTFCRVWLKRNPGTLPGVFLSERCHITFRLLLPRPSSRAFVTQPFSGASQ